jgi:N-acetylglucosamine-6-sulfatase
MKKISILLLITKILFVPHLLAQNGSGNRPNIVFFMTDDQAYDALDGRGRFPYFRMPHVERIAAQGISFRNGFCTTSLCSPSRATCLTGMYSHKTGVPNNDPEVDPHSNLVFISEMLQQAGYDTAFIGKWHQAHTNAPRRGFHHWASFTGQGTYQDPVFNVNGEEIVHKKYNTDVITDYAVEWIASRPSNKPFAIFVWHKAPHEPQISAPRHISYYLDIPVPEPHNYRSSFVGKPEWLRRGQLHGLFPTGWNASANLTIPPLLSVTKVYNDKDILPFFTEYFRTLEAVNESTGSILDILEQKQYRDNSLIIYTSDNGYNMVAHRSDIDKRTMWEESIRIPFIIQFPGSPSAGTGSDDMVINADFAPTILQAAGIPIPTYFDGRALQPLTASVPPDSWRKSFLYVYKAEPSAPGIVTHVGVRNDRYKYTIFPEETEGLSELYDIKSDPAEVVNLIKNPAYTEVLSHMQSELRRLAADVSYTLPNTLR